MKSTAWDKVKLNLIVDTPDHTIFACLTIADLWCRLQEALQTLDSSTSSKWNATSFAAVMFKSTDHSKMILQHLHDIMQRRFSAERETAVSWLKTTKDSRKRTSELPNKNAMLGPDKKKLTGGTEYLTFERTLQLPGSSASSMRANWTTDGPLLALGFN